MKGIPKGELRYAMTLIFFHKVTSRASAPQNTLWETLLRGAVKVKPVTVESTLAKKLLYYWENRSVTSRLGNNRDGIHPFLRDAGKPNPPIKLFTSDRSTAPGAPQC